MELVSSNKPRDIEANRAEEEARFALRELAANLMRVTRGAGKPYLILNQVFELANAAIRFQKITGRWPDLGGELSVDDPRASNFDSPIKDATDAMLRGALQMVASRLLGQIPQEAMGSTELFVQGVHRWADEVGYQAERPRREAPSRSQEGRAELLGRCVGRKPRAGCSRGKGAAAAQEADADRACRRAPRSRRSHRTGSAEAESATNNLKATRRLAGQKPSGMGERMPTQRP
jgi:hypothetical protein